MMEIRPIRSEADLEAALAEIDRLMDAQPETPEGDRLDLLVTLADAFEARTAPMPQLDPIATILAHLENRVCRAEIWDRPSARGREWPRC
jgi:HTH-type transcriptional regulator/antitoxin HigA